MKKYVKKILFLILLFIITIGTCTGCTNINKITSKESEKEIEETISQSINHGNFKDFKKIMEKHKENGYNLSYYNDNDDFSKFIISKLKENKVEDYSIELLWLLEEYQYKNEEVKNSINSIFVKNNNSFKDKLLILNKLKSLKYYNSIKITKDEINKYIEDNNTTISKNNNTNSYYDNREHKFSTKNRDIQSNGDIITTSAQYFGDFAILNKDREYLDSTYQIHHEITHTLYFRGCVLVGIDKINEFKYAPPFLFSTYKGKTDIFEVDNKVYADIIYTIE